jgi:chromosome segregation ATPase
MPSLDWKQMIDDRIVAAVGETKTTLRKALTSPRALEKWREQVEEQEREFARERRQDEREQRRAAATREVAALRAEVDSLRAELTNALSAVGDLGENIAPCLDRIVDQFETRTTRMRTELFDAFERGFSELKAQLDARPIARGGAFRFARTVKKMAI